MGTQASYRIEIKGQLAMGWEAWFSGIQLQVEEKNDGSWVTYLESPAIDQSALHGLLNKIRDLNLTLLSVNPIIRTIEKEK